MGASRVVLTLFFWLGACASPPIGAEPPTGPVGVASTSPVAGASAAATGGVASRPLDPLAAESRTIRDELLTAGQAVRLQPAVWPKGLDPLVTFDASESGHLFVIRQVVVVERTRLVCFRSQEAVGFVIGFEWNRGGLTDPADPRWSQLAELATTPPLFVHGFAAPGEAADEAAARALAQRRGDALLERLVAAGAKREHFQVLVHGTELSAVLDEKDAPKMARAEIGDRDPTTLAEILEVSIPNALSIRLVERARAARPGGVTRGPHVGRRCWKFPAQDRPTCRSPVDADGDVAGTALAEEMTRFARRGCRRE